MMYVSCTVCGLCVDVTSRTAGTMRFAGEVPHVVLFRH
jgi:formate hydrogenlyase subunit 6/NADH:ubiquinone oxidoreductase subunit I